MVPELHPPFQQPHDVFVRYMRVVIPSLPAAVRLPTPRITVILGAEALFARRVIIALEIARIQIL
jgi:hypothetical protein